MKNSLIPAIFVAPALAFSTSVPAFADSNSAIDLLNSKIMELEIQNQKLTDELKTIKDLLKESALVSSPDSPENPVSATVSYKALLLKPTFDFAQTFAAKDSASKDTDDLPYGDVSTLYDLDFDYSYAYEIGPGFQAANSPWGAQIAFRELLLDEDESCSFEGGNSGSCGSTIAHGNAWFGYGDEEGDVIDGRNDFSYNDLEALVSYDPVDTGAIDWKLFAGVRNVNIDKSLSSELVRSSSDIGGGSTKISSSYNGIGPALSALASKEIFTDNLNIYGKARIALLNGTTTSKFEETYTDRVYSNNSKASQDGLNPAYGFSIGLDYKWNVTDAFSLNFDASYEFDKFLNAVADTQFPDDINPYSSRTSFSDLTLSGASFGLKATYLF